MRWRTMGWVAALLAATTAMASAQQSNLESSEEDKEGREGKAEGGEREGAISFPLSNLKRKAVRN